MSEEVSVLIVEDSRVDREVLKLVLGSAPYVVQTLNDGEAARIFVDNQPPVDIVVTDVNLPKLNGIELTKYIRNDHKWSKVPIIALSSRMDANTVMALNRSGASSILSKPYHPERLQEEVFKFTGYERVEC